MRKYLISAVLLVAAVLFLTWNFTGSEKKLVQQPYRQPYYIALGDSLAVGMGAPANMGYSDKYFNYLLTKDKNYKYLNIGHGGDTTENLLNVININQKQLEKATIITVHIGINDLFDKIRTMEVQISPPEIQGTYNVIAENYEKIVSDLQKNAPHAKIILLNYYNPFINNTWFESHIAYLNTIIKNTSEKHKLLYLDVHSLFANTGLKYLLKGNYSEDPIHPNIDGYTLISRKLSEINP